MLQIQSMDCRKGITRGVVKKLKYLQKESPFARHLKAHVSNLIMPFRMFSCFSLWIYPFVASQKVSFDIFLVLIQKALAETENLYYEKLPELWLSSSHAFTGKQKKHYELLHEQIYSFQVALRDVEIALDRYRFLVISKIQMTNLEKFRNNTLESLLFSYAIDNEPYDLRYTAFDSLLDEISVILSEENPTYRYKLGYAEMAKSALMRYLSNSDAMLIWDVIKNIVGYEPTSYE
ncbi:MAG: hypothetical protein K8L91_18500 [Anaerolineae bacterium]|nr:hypothetical protein [Anaerolineae bacterium]